MVENVPAMWETWVQSLGWEDPLEEGMATHSSILAWRILMDRGAWWATVTKSQTRLSDFTFTSTTMVLGVINCGSHELAQLGSPFSRTYCRHS